MCTRARISPCADARATASPSPTPSAGGVRRRRGTARRGPAPVSGSRSGQTIELNCLPRRVDSSELAVGHSRSAGRDDGEVGPAVGRREHAAVAQPRRRPTGPRRRSSRSVSMPAYAGTTRAISSRIACRRSRSRRRSARSGSTRARERRRRSPTRCAPRRPRARDLGAERDAPLGRGLRAAAALLVAGRGGQQHHGLAGIHEHLGGDDDVLVDAHRRRARARSCD